MVIVNKRKNTQDNISISGTLHGQVNFSSSNTKIRRWRKEGKKQRLVLLLKDYALSLRQQVNKLEPRFDWRIYVFMNDDVGTTEYSAATHFLAKGYLEAHRIYSIEQIIGVKQFVVEHKVDNVGLTELTEEEIQALKDKARFDLSQQLNIPENSIEVELIATEVEAENTISNDNPKLLYNTIAVNRGAIIFRFTIVSRNTTEEDHETFRQTVENNNEVISNSILENVETVANVSDVTLDTSHRIEVETNHEISDRYKTTMYKFDRMNSVAVSELLPYVEEFRDADFSDLGGEIARQNIDAIAEKLTVDGFFDPTQEELDAYIENTDIFQVFKSMIYHFIDGLNAGILLDAKNTTTQNENQRLTEYRSILMDPDLLKEYIKKNYSGMRTALIEVEYETKETFTLAPEYELYLTRYGVPPNAIFESEKLNEIKKELGII